MGNQIEYIVKRIALRCALLSFVLFSACEPDLSDDAIPYVSFSDIILSLNAAENNVLKFDGGYKTIGGGVRGIIVYRENMSTYFAYERNSSYHPNEACATVEVHSSTLYISDPCSGSTFDFHTGNPISGPATRPLRKYAVQLSTFDLTITDEVAN